MGEEENPGFSTAELTVVQRQPGLSRGAAVVAAIFCLAGFGSGLLLLVQYSVLLQYCTVPALCFAVEG